MTYDLPDELLDLLASNGGQGLDFHSLVEIVDGHEEEFLLCSLDWKKSNNIYLPLDEWLGGDNVMQLGGGMLMLLLCSWQPLHL